MSEAVDGLMMHDLHAQASVTDKPVGPRLSLGWTFTQPDAKVTKLDKIPGHWQLTDERGGFRLAYEPREHAEGRSLSLMGEVHVVDGTMYLVRYDGEFLNGFDDGSPLTRERGWFMPEMSDAEAEALRFKLKKDKFMEDNPWVGEMVKLARRVKRNSKAAAKELYEILQSRPERIDQFRDAILEYHLGDDLLVYTVPRRIKRLVRGG